MRYMPYLQVFCAIYNKRWKKWLQSIPTGYKVTQLPTVKKVTSGQKYYPAGKFAHPIQLGLSIAAVQTPGKVNGPTAANYSIKATKECDTSAYKHRVISPYVEAYRTGTFSM